MSPGAGRAVLLERPGSHRLVTAEPAPPGPGEVLVRVAAAGVCGSDRELYEGNRAPDYVRYPVVPGHEWSGTVEAVGEGVDPALTGRACVAEGFRNCRSCDRCRAGETSLCSGGYDETGFTRPGGFATTLTVPARLLHLLRPGTDLRAAALLEPAAVVAAAALTAAARPAERIAVVGAGTLGLLAVQLLAAGSPAELLVVDPRADRAGQGVEFGGTGARTPGQLGPLAGRYDLVVETAGAAGSAAGAVALARRGGRVVLTGLPAPGATGLDPTELAMRQITVHTVFGAPSAAWAHAVRCFEAGLLDPAPLITHELPLEGYADAVKLVGGGDPGVGKVLLRP
ncbi:zinc-dependent alcohol dehydrogenase [Streptomyces zingiberis]|uniref:2-deoxy-scyllo-inosamine dehydrogenase n=1 Tax=Streptomyces zingiberis TaxID=2053010 RepID=A0ABX1BP74_9ACTN|nr:alcohol dehydrogenase catalytic domain-containing protein [Streptomyces zingiberis]NJP99533.1 alcohol dehydrogenase catalytic domain-containing protein [Streptomyces zingiberis]